MQIIYRNINNEEHNLSIKLSSFQGDCKIAKLKPRFKKVTRSDLKKLSKYFAFATIIKTN